MKNIKIISLLLIVFLWSAGKMSAQNDSIYNGEFSLKETESSIFGLSFNSTYHAQDIDRLYIDFYDADNNLLLHQYVFNPVKFYDTYYFRAFVENQEVAQIVPSPQKNLSYAFFSEYNQFPAECINHSVRLELYLVLKNQANGAGKSNKLIFYTKND